MLSQRPGVDVVVCIDVDPPGTYEPEYRTSSVPTLAAWAPFQSRGVRFLTASRRLRCIHRLQLVSAEARHQLRSFSEYFVEDCLELAPPIDDGGTEPHWLLSDR